MTAARIRSWFDSDGAKFLSRAATVVAVPWCVWVTQHIFHCKAFMERGDRFSMMDGYLLEQRIDHRIDSLPPQDWRNRIMLIEQDMRAHQAEQRRWIDEMSKDFVRKDEIR